MHTAFDEIDLDVALPVGEHALAIHAANGSAPAGPGQRIGRDCVRVGHDPLVIRACHGTAHNLDTVGGNLSIQGGAGQDTGQIYDVLDKGSGQYTVNFLGVTKPFFSLNSLGVEDLTLNVHGTGSTVKIEGTPAIMTRVNGGGGNDQFLLSPTAQNLSQFGGGLVLRGNGGSDHVHLYDKNSAHPADEFLVTGNSVSRDHFGDLSYDGMENITLNLGNAANKVELFGTKATTKVTIKGNGGNDVFNITDAPKSAVVLDGGAGMDVMKWSTGDAPSDPDSGFNLIDKISIEQTQFPIRF